MPEVTFSVHRADQTVEVGQYGFSSGWVVVRREGGQPDQFVSRLYMTEAEAQTKADELTAQDKANNA